MNFKVNDEKQNEYVQNIGLHRYRQERASSEAIQSIPYDNNRKTRRQIGKMVIALKTELAKRPHIPNKKERKELRRMASQGRLN